MVGTAKRAVVDTNVLVASNGRGTHASIACRASSAEFLLALQRTGTLLEDDRDLVFDEYRRYCNFDGQPGVGDYFFAWYVNSRRTPRWVEQVAVAGEPRVDMVPTALLGFDADDQKWIAIFLAGGGDYIANATDSDWKNDRPLLEANGVTVLELCPST